MTPQFDEATLSKLSTRDLKTLLWRQKWLQTARPKQLPPDTDDPEWNEWIFCAGRGAGKTHAGANWLAYEALTGDPKHPCFVIAPTLNDVRYTCFEGPTGILSLIPPELVKDYNKTNLLITLDTGTVIRGFSAEEPERLRGPQCQMAWLEETGAWATQTAQDTFNMFMMGLRLGPRPRFICTTTPRPNELMRKLLSPKPHRHVVTGTTYENRANLPQSFFDQLVQYEGTQLGRQELLGELIDAEEGAIVSRSWLKKWPAKKPLPTFEFLILSLDTALTEKTINRKTHDPDPTACGALGAFWNTETERTEVLVVDAWDEHLGFPDLLARVKREMQVAYGDDVNAKPMLKPLIGPKRLSGTGRKADITLIENKGSGTSLLQMLEREGIPAYPYNPGNADKASRLHMVSHIFQQGLVWFPESVKYPGKFTTWVEPMVTQLCTYRGEGSTRHDDYIDVLSQGIRLLIDKSIVTGVKKKKDVREREQRDDEERQAPRPRSNPYAA